MSLQRFAREEGIAVDVELAGIGLPGRTTEGIDAFADLKVDESNLGHHLLPTLTGQPASNSGSPEVDVVECLFGYGSTGGDVREL